jgi:uncharacterized protein (DUF2141 family)
MKLFYWVILFLFSATPAFSQTLVVEISGIRNDAGCLRLAFFINEASFRSEKPVMERCLEKSRLSVGCLIARFDSVPQGTYGIAVLDDENRDGKLDYRLVIPKEGVGFSNYLQHGIKRPSFSDFCFRMTKDKPVRVAVQMKYYGK